MDLGQAPAAREGQVGHLSPEPQQHVVHRRVRVRAEQDLLAQGHQGVQQSHDRLRLPGARVPGDDREVLRARGGVHGGPLAVVQTLEPLRDVRRHAAESAALLEAGPPQVDDELGHLLVLLGGHEARKAAADAPPAAAVRVDVEAVDVAVAGARRGGARPAAEVLDVHKLGAHHGPPLLGLQHGGALRLGPHANVLHRDLLDNTDRDGERPARARDRDGVPDVDAARRDAARARKLPADGRIRRRAVLDPGGDRTQTAGRHLLRGWAPEESEPAQAAAHAAGLRLAGGALGVLAEPGRPVLDPGPGLLLHHQGRLRVDHLHPARHVGAAGRAHGLRAALPEDLRRPEAVRGAAFHTGMRHSARIA
mmetsp:Transcript_15146/g.45390  ORF Transcript_15146/g.45390 Transcript_15146/m.45390 type:complete len:365 (-) Transcript_15146:1059-2153(-)